MNAILAPIDFSPVSDEVGREALRLGAALRQRVVFLHVLPPLEGEPLELVNLTEVMSAGEANARGWLDTFMRGLKVEGSAAEPIVTSGFVAEEILLHAKIISAGHIVLGSRGHSLLHELLLAGARARHVCGAGRSLRPGPRRLAPPPHRLKGLATLAKNPTRSQGLGTVTDVA